jgi:hypothetical protein
MVNAFTLTDCAGCLIVTRRSLLSTDTTKRTPASHRTQYPMATRAKRQRCERVQPSRATDILRAPERSSGARIVSLLFYNLILFITSETLIPCIHWTFFSHFRLKQGEQSIPVLTTICDGPYGPVLQGAVGPNSARTCAPAAAAICIGPVSVVINRSESFASAASSFKDVSPAQFTAD